ncbi:MAG: SUF system Fe-S cluster assembly regulator [Candidatus Binatia bacterium]
MIRISRLTDYGIVILSYMAAHPDQVHNASSVAVGAHLPLPTVGKLLRAFARGGLLSSHRGINGGYSLARPPREISVAGVIRALEGPIGLTLCRAESPGDCAHEAVCRVRTHWQRINQAIRQALEGITLSEMAAPVSPQFMPVAEGDRREGPDTMPKAALG